MFGLSVLFEVKKGITALIGGGGKTSAMYALAEELRQIGSVIVCTTTHILRPPQYPYAQHITEPLCRGDVVSTGVLEGRKLTAPQQSFPELCSLADYILVEADGSRQLPLKAHAQHEPVIPEDAATVLVVVGIDGLGKKIRDAAHRPELYAALVNSDIDALVTAKMIQAVIVSYPRCDGLIINKADDDTQIGQAERLADFFMVPVAITAFQSEHPIKAYRRKRI